MFEFIHHTYDTLNWISTISFTISSQVTWPLENTRLFYQLSAALLLKCIAANLTLYHSPTWYTRTYAPALKHWEIYSGRWLLLFPLLVLFLRSIFRGAGQRGIKILANKGLLPKVKSVEMSFCEDCLKKNAFPFKAFVIHSGARVIENWS